MKISITNCTVQIAWLVRLKLTDSLMTVFYFSFTKLDKEARADLDADFTLEEVKAAVKQLANNKASFPDGFGVEFYKACSSLLAPLIICMMDQRHGLCIKFSISW